MDKLTKEQLDHYYEHGYVVLPNFFTKDEFTRLDQEIERVGKDEWVLQLGLKSNVADLMARDERILKITLLAWHPCV